MLLACHMQVARKQSPVGPGLLQPALLQHALSLGGGGVGAVVWGRGPGLSLGHLTGAVGWGPPVALQSCMAWGGASAAVIHVHVTHMCSSALANERSVLKRLHHLTYKGVWCSLQSKTCKLACMSKH